MKCPVILSDKSICQKPGLSVHRGLCSEHSHFSKRCGYFLGFNLIVKNESDCLERTLKSVSGISDEIVITDTGSTDDTVSIALKYTDKVFYHEWADSFSEARNWSLQYSTSEWICAIDGDEWLVNPEDVRPILDKCKGIMTLMCLIESEMVNSRIATNYFQRIFRKGTAYYEGIVHNQLVHKYPMLDTPIRFRHSGYNETPEIMKKKHERTINLLRKQLIDDPDNVFVMCNLARTLCNEGQIEEAEQIIDMALSLNPDDDIHQMLLFNKSLCFVGTDRIDEVKVLLRKGLTLNPDNIDFLFLKADVALQSGHFSDAINSIYSYRYVKQKQVSQHQIIFDYYDVEVSENKILAKSYIGLKKYDTAIHHLTKVLLSDRYDIGIWKSYLFCCKQIGNMDAFQMGVDEMIRLGLDLTQITE